MNKTNMTVDGIDYSVEHEVEGNMEHIEVKDINDSPISVAIIDHNHETVEVVYMFDDYVEGDELTPVPYNYHEYTSVSNIAEWMASTHPING